MILNKFKKTSFIEKKWELIRNQVLLENLTIKNLFRLTILTRRRNYIQDLSCTRIDENNVVVDWLLLNVKWVVIQLYSRPKQMNKQ